MDPGELAGAGWEELATLEIRSWGYGKKGVR